MINDLKKIKKYIYYTKALITSDLWLLFLAGEHKILKSRTSSWTCSGMIIVTFFVHRIMSHLFEVDTKLPHFAIAYINT